MSKFGSYNEIMEKIEVTDEMRSRILKNVSSVASVNTNKVISFLSAKKIAAVAACVALMFVSVVIIQNIAKNDIEPSGNAAIPVNGTVECANAKELSEKAGFNVDDVEGVPFEVSSTVYSWCWNEFAQIEYFGKDNTLTYRKTEKDEDISGDYTEYESVVDKTVNGSDITVKGNDNMYSLAIWRSGEYSYSIYFDYGVDLESIEKIIEFSNF